MVEDVFIVGDLDKGASKGHFDPYSLSPAEQITALQNKVVRLVFRKADNTKRVAYATRNSRLINLYMYHGSSLSIKEAEKREEFNNKADDFGFDIEQEIQRDAIKFFDLEKRQFRTYKPYPKDDDFIKGSRLLHADVNELGEFLFPSWVEFEPNSANWFSLAILPKEDALRRGINTDEVGEDLKQLSKYVKKSDERYASDRVAGNLGAQKLAFEHNLENDVKDTIKAQDAALAEDRLRDYRIKQNILDTKSDVSRIMKYWLGLKQAARVVPSKEYAKVTSLLMNVGYDMRVWDPKYSKVQSELGVMLWYSNVTDDQYLLSPAFIANVTLGKVLSKQPIVIKDSKGKAHNISMINFRRPVLDDDITNDERAEMGRLKELLVDSGYAKLTSIPTAPYESINSITEKDVKQMVHLWAYATTAPKETDKPYVLVDGAPNDLGGFTGTIKHMLGKDQSVEPGGSGTVKLNMTANKVVVVYANQTYLVDKTKSCSYSDAIMKLMEKPMPGALRGMLNTLRTDGFNLRKKLPDDRYLSELVSRWKTLLG